MNVLILGGFLGSGKTTSLMQLAKYLVATSPAEKENKVMILENEIGQVGIDDEFLRSGGFQVSNLFSGCACCTVSGVTDSKGRRESVSLYSPSPTAASVVCSGSRI